MAISKKLTTIICQNKINKFLYTVSDTSHLVSPEQC